MRHLDIDPYGEENWDDDIVVDQINYDLQNKIYRIMTNSLMNEFCSSNNIEMRNRIIHSIQKEMKSDRFFNDYDYRIICDESNNPPELVDRNQIRIRIFTKKTTEISVIHFQLESRINQIM